MRLVEPDHRLHGAGLCFLCETAIDHPKQKAINTNIEFDPPFQTPLTGEKYVCEGCGETIAVVLGFVRKDDVEQLEAIDASLKHDLLELQTLADNLVQKAQGLPVPDGAVTVTRRKEKKNGS